MVSFLAIGLLVLRQALTEYPIKIRIFLFLVSFFLIAGSMGLLWGILGTKLLVDAHSVTLIRLLFLRTILLNDIDGYRVGGYDFYYLVLKNKGGSLRIPKSLTNKDAIAWITGRFSSLEIRSRDKDMEVLLANQQFGATREERQARLQEARKVENAGSMPVEIL